MNTAQLQLLCKGLSWALIFFWDPLLLTPVMKVLAAVQQAAVGAGWPFSPAIIWSSVASTGMLCPSVCTSHHSTPLGQSAYTRAFR